MSALSSNHLASLNEPHTAAASIGDASGVRAVEGVVEGLVQRVRVGRSLGVAGNGVGARGNDSVAEGNGGMTLLPTAGSAYRQVQRQADEQAQAEEPRLIEATVIQTAGTADGGSTSVPIGGGDSAESSPAPAVRHDAGGAAHKAENPGMSAAEVDGLARRLYDPIVRRLRAELWVDRERTGTLIDRRW